ATRLPVEARAATSVSPPGCSSAVSSTSSSDHVQAWKFKSDPPATEIHTPTDQTCKTPCELSVPSREQLVIITKNNYQPQTVQVTLGPQPDHSFWENPPPTLAPNPVHVVLHPVSKPVHHVGGHRSVSKTHTAKAEPVPSAASSPSPPPPPAQKPAASPVSPPPVETMNCLAVAPNDCQRPY